jgi:putative DNA-invertase from lambdoid prophage Rac
MKAAIYSRVSTQEQNPLLQENTLKEYAKNNNIEVYKCYSDTTSGSKSSRPGLNTLMFDGRKKLFDVVLVYKLDRLGRSLQHLLNIIEEWQKRGIAFISISQGMDTTQASGKLVFNVLGAIAEFERELISERTKLGLRSAHNVGKRGKDKHPRKKGGYYLRYQTKEGASLLNLPQY